MKYHFTSNPPVVQHNIHNDAQPQGVGLVDEPPQVVGAAVRACTMGSGRAHSQRHENTRAVAPSQASPHPPS